MKFLPDRKMEKELARLFKKATQARIAVAYWGADATDRIAISELKSKDAQVVCNLTSGGCNPKEIQKLQKLLGAKRVSRLDNLHAKVWWTDKGAIVGSSNASSNGFGGEGEFASGLIEGNVLVTEPPLLADIRSWLDRAVFANASEITPFDMNRAQERWARFRAAWRPPSGRSLLQLLKQDPNCLSGKNVYVWCWKWEPTNKTQDRRVKQAQRDRNNDEIDAWHDVDKKWNMPDASILEFERTQNGKAFYRGCSQVLHNSPFHRINSKQNMLLCGPAGNRVDGVKMGNASEWNAAIARALAAEPNREEWPLEEFAQRYLTLQ